MSKRKTLDMTTGPFFTKILIFALPLMLTGILQLVYNAADVIVIGRFGGSTSLAAVGATGSLVNLIVNLFIGMATGSGVLSARCIGAEDNEGMHKSVHTAMLLSILCGFFVAGFGFFCSRFFLKWMGTPSEVLPLSALYLKIFFLGAPASLVYNFGAAIVRATGDTRRPLYILGFTGLVNVGLNLLLVIVFHLDVAGVAIATVVAQYLSALLIVLRLTHLPNACRLHPRELRFHKAQLSEIVRIGLPAGIQSTLFSLSNVLIQSTINSFGTVAMAGNTAASNADSFVYTCTNAISQTTMTFSSQNIGAKRYGNLGKVYFRCLGLTVCVAVTLGALGLLFPGEIIRIFSTDPMVIAVGTERLKLMMATYFLCSLMDVAGGQLRGMGRSFEPMLITLLGACGLRIVWIFTVFPLSPSLVNLYISYPVSWGITFLALFLCYFPMKRKLCEA